MRLLKVCTLLCTALFALCTTARADGAPFVLVIDAGHGGVDGGAVGAFSKEKDINLRVALEFGKLVSTHCKDVNIIYTRKTDVFLTLQERSNIANAAHADLFISIHTNSVESGNPVCGSETYVLGMHRADENLNVAKNRNSLTRHGNGKPRQERFIPGTTESEIGFQLMQTQYLKESIALATCIQKQYKRAGRPDKGVRQAGYSVLRLTARAAILTELGFITTPEEEQYLNSESGVATLARCIYNGFVEYRKLYKKGGGQFVVNSLGSEPKEALSETAMLPKVAKDEPAAPKLTPQGDKPLKVRHTDLLREEEESLKSPGLQEPKNSRTDSRQATPMQPEESAIEFRVQIFVSPNELKANDSRLKGLAEADYYKEAGNYKYTVGHSSSYQDMRRLKQEVSGRFPDAFVIALEHGKRINLQEALGKAARMENQGPKNR